jgi:hypothetical protein
LEFRSRQLALERWFLHSGALVLTLRRCEITTSWPERLSGRRRARRYRQLRQDELATDLILSLARFGLKDAQFSALSRWRRSLVSEPTAGTHQPITRCGQAREAHFSQDLTDWREFGVDLSGD